MFFMLLMNIWNILLKVCENELGVLLLMNWLFVKIVEVVFVVINIFFVIKIFFVGFGGEFVCNVNVDIFCRDLCDSCGDEYEILVSIIYVFCFFVVYFLYRLSFWYWVGSNL